MAYSTTGRLQLLRACAGVGVLVMLLGGCGTQMTADVASPEPLAQFRVIGYVTDTGAQITDEQLEQLTHVNYAFALPNAEPAAIRDARATLAP